MKKNDLVGWPDDWPPYHNACSDPCDMLSGPCACGAWHKLYEWDFEKQTRKPSEVEQLRAENERLRKCYAEIYQGVWLASEDEVDFSDEAAAWCRAEAERQSKKLRELKQG